MKSCDFYCKRHILAWMHVVWAILRQNRLGVLTSRGEPEKSQKVSDSHRNDVSPLIQGLRYRAACDEWVSEESSILESCCLRPIMKNSVSEELRVRRFADIRCWSYYETTGRKTNHFSRIGCCTGNLRYGYGQCQRLPFANNMALASTWLWRHFAVACGSV